MPPTVNVSDSTYERLTFAANLYKISEDQVVERLVREFSARARSPLSAPPGGVEADRRVTVSTHYMGTSARGLFDPLTNELRITEGPASGTTYASPTAAAIAVVSEVNPSRRHPNTNGKNFWNLPEHDGASLGAWLIKNPRK